MGTVVMAMTVMMVMLIMMEMMVTMMMMIHHLPCQQNNYNNKHPITATTTTTQLSLTLDSNAHSSYAADELAMQPPFLPVNEDGQHLNDEVTQPGCMQRNRVHTCNWDVSATSYAISCVQPIHTRGSLCNQLQAIALPDACKGITFVWNSLQPVASSCSTSCMD